jgi:hypothetical protein
VREDDDGVVGNVKPIGDPQSCGRSLGIDLSGPERVFVMEERSRQVQLIQHVAAVIRASCIQAGCPG